MSEKSDRNDQADATEQQGNDNKNDIETLSGAVDKLIFAHQDNARGIGTLTTLMSEAKEDRAASRKASRSAMFFAVAAFLAIFLDLRAARQDRGDIIALSAQNKELLVHIENLVESIKSSTTPNGCVLSRNEAFRAEAVREIQNDVRAYHKEVLLPQDPEILARMSAICDSEVPMTTPTTGGKK